MEIDVRAEPAGSQAATRLLEAYFADLARRFPDGFDSERTVSADPEELVPPRGNFLMVVVDGKPPGCGAVKTLTPEVGEIKRMWLDPGTRGMGLGRRLLTALEDAARTLGHHEVRLDTSAHLVEALGLYRSAGYAETDAYNDNHYAAHWFAKSL